MVLVTAQCGLHFGFKRAKPRKYITKSKSGHYTATVRAKNEPKLWSANKLSSAYEANRLADEFLAMLPKSS